VHRVLVIGEDPDRSQSLAFRLGLCNLEASASAAELPLAVRSIVTFQPDLILMDSAIDDARDLYNFIYEITDKPIVVLGDQRLQEDVLWFLEQGAADYVSQGVSEKVLAAKISAIARRADESNGQGVLQFGSVKVDTDRHEVQKDGVAVRLTPTEYRLLLALAENPGKPCSHRSLLSRVWGEEFRQCAHYLRLYIGYLRHKLEDDPSEPRLIKTDWGLGYRLMSDQRSSGPAVIRRAAASSP
jgi:DNA-binding response OmpR family regulator